MYDSQQLRLRPLHRVFKSGNIAGASCERTPAHWRLSGNDKKILNSLFSNEQRLAISNHNREDCSAFGITHPVYTVW